MAIDIDYIIFGGLILGGIWGVYWYLTSYGGM